LVSRFMSSSLSRARVRACHFRKASNARSTVARGLFNVPVRTTRKESLMGREDQAAGRIKQAKGKLNDIAGAAKGDTSQQTKGKIQKGVGKMQAKLGKLDTGSRRRDVQ
jgi:uncharacterized protein YjbJ (UPF0337 family)